MKLSRAIFTLLTAALVATLLVRFLPIAYEQAGAIGCITAFLAVSALSAPLLSWSDGRVHANTLTNLIPSVYASLDVVSRELVGFIPSVTRDPRTDRVAANQTLYSPYAPAATLSTYTPAMAVPAAGDQTIGTKSLTLSNFKEAGFSWTGEEQYSLNSGGPGYGGIKGDQIEQCLRAFTNQIESDIFTVGYLAASRGYGTAGTTAFATNTGETAQLKKILDDNGAPLDSRSLVIDTTAGAALRTLTQLTKANEAGTTMTLRDGELLNLNKLMIKESAQITAPAVGSGASYTTNTAGYAIGATALTLITGTGTILAGDIITITGDTNKYVVAAALSGGVVTLAAPGLRKAVAASATAVTVVAAATRNLAFSRNAIVLATRLIEMPAGGDMAIDRQIITDPRSGISFEIALYPGYGMNKVVVRAAWGVSAFKPEHIATLLG